MKKFYSAPLMEIEKFDICDIITTSGGGAGSGNPTAEIELNNAKTNAYEVIIESQW